MKTLEELLKEHDDWCEGRECRTCPYNGYNYNPNIPSAECTTVFIYEAMKEGK